MLDWEDVFIAPWLVQRPCPSVQTNLCGDTSNSCGNAVSADGLSSSAASLPQHSSKVESNFGHFLKTAAVQIWRHVVSLAMGLPIFPYLAPNLGSCLHSAIDNPCVSSLRVTFVTTADLRRKPVQIYLSGKGKNLLK